MKLSNKKIWLIAIMICGLVSASLGYVLWGIQWPVGSNVAFFVNPNTAQVAGELAAVNSASASWNAINPAGLLMTYSGPTSSTTASGNGENAIAWDNEGNNGTLATAYAWTSGSTMVETDMVFNDFYTWTTSGAQYDIETVALHELGHWVGLDHSATGIMTPSYGGVDRSVDSDARAGFEALYGSGGGGGTTTPTIDLDPTNMNFSDSGSDTFMVRNSGSGTLNYQINDNRAWMSVSPSSGSSGGVWRMITVTVDSSGMEPGEYSGSISVTSGDASNSPQTIAVTLDIVDRPPNVSITSPPEGDIKREIIPIRAAATDDFGVDKVEFYVDNILRWTDRTSPYDYDWDAGPLVGGDYSIRVVAYDTSDQTDQDSITLTIPDLPPNVSITSPTEGTTIETKIVTINADASDDFGVNKVEFYVANVLHKTDTSPPYDYDWDTSPFSHGDYTIRAVAYDTVDQTDFDSITLTVPEDKPPSVTISSPADGATVIKTVTVRANASDDHGVQKVEFYVDNSLLKTDTNAPYTLAWNPDPFSSGFHTIKALAYDTIDQTDEDSIRLKVDKPPAVTLTSPTSGSEVFGWNKIVSTAADDYGIKEVQFYINEILHTVDSSPPYQFDWNTDAVQNGNYSIRAQVIDTMNQSNQDEISLYVIPHPPNGFSGRKENNSSTLLEEYINVLSWQANGLNQAISKYKIYQVVDGIWTFLSEVNGNTFEYWHRNVDKERRYSYVVTAVDTNNKEGKEASVVVQ
ncbi:Ig-like domain-containing protein [Acidobacteriota bacterium]